MDPVVIQRYEMLVYIYLFLTIELWTPTRFTTTHYVVKSIMYIVLGFRENRLKLQTKKKKYCILSILNLLGAVMHDNSMT